ncbi:type II toxin-antitoxin system VapC family toxin [Sphingomonas adhaesiva]|uniref:type II toxin-antitoxin system VapC family toxin n=1 Tax=Sphingomonas adhaesiva TaxID=28212 RepID=UPI002FF880A6
MLVVDASVVVKALTLEPNTYAARTLIFEATEVVAPSIISMEVASALSKKVRYHGLPIDAATDAMLALPNFITQYVPLDIFIVSAFHLSLQLAHALQDCMYLAVAIEHDCPLATSDRKFANRAIAAGHGHRIVVPAAD